MTRIKEELAMKHRTTAAQVGALRPSMAVDPLASHFYPGTHNAFLSLCLLVRTTRQKARVSMSPTDKRLQHEVYICE
jgi:hypothetical protein